MRVLMLATYFPKPLNPLMGTWALAQAQALRRHGLELEVVSFTAWVPRRLARTPGARAYAECPAVHEWGALRVHYPRWLVYPLSPIRPFSERWPRPFLEIGWRHAEPWLERFLDRFQPDIVFAHHTAVNGFLAARLHDRHGIPFVVTDHDFGEIASCEHWPARRRLFRYVVGRASVMIAVARRMEETMRRLFPEARTCTVYNGTEPIPAPCRLSPRPEELDGHTVLFSCGAFYHRKGFPLLIDAYAKVAPHFPDSVLRIAGDGAERRLVEQRILQHRLERQVQLIGRLSHSQVLQEMVWADAFVLAGWDEPFATVFLEAMSAGKPIVFASDGGIAEVAEDGVHGLAVPPRDVDALAAALGRLLSHREERLRMGAMARVLFESRLTWSHNAARMAELFETATAGRLA
jgi:glycosyltransferase involved in cell wall biosynthesis